MEGIIEKGMVATVSVLLSKKKVLKIYRETSYSFTSDYSSSVAGARGDAE